MEIPNGSIPNPCNFNYGIVNGVECAKINPRFWFSGDPVANWGWINSMSADTRFLVNVGPFSLNKEDPVEIMCAYSIKQGNDPLGSISETRKIVKLAQELYANNFGFNPVSVLENQEIVSYSLSQNYPNPFNPVTKIRFTVPAEEHVTVKLYDVLGKEVATLINKNVSAGSHEFDLNGSSLTSGVYFYQLKAGSFSETKRMMILK